MGLFGKSKDPGPSAAAGAKPAGVHRVGRGVTFTGELRFAGRLEFDGHLAGSLVAEPMAGSCVVIGPHAQVHGGIEADVVIISGHVEGPIRARSRLDIQSGARVIGDLGYLDLQIQHGAGVEGALKSLEGQPVALKLVANSRN